MLSWPHYFVVPDVGIEIIMDLFTKDRHLLRWRSL